MSTSAVARFDELDEDDVGDVDFQHDDDEDARGDARATATARATAWSDGTERCARGSIRSAAR